MQQQRRRPPISASPIAFNNTSNRPIRQTNRSMPVTVSQCSGCSQPMYNSHLSNVLDRLWHPDCVRCIVCRTILNEQCYSREGKLYCKDDFIKKYIHRCFSCQNLIQSHELIRRVRAGRIYHADCFSCIKCKRILQDDDIALLIPTDGSKLNDMDYLCQICSNPGSKLVKSSTGISSSSNADEDETTDSEVSNTINGRVPSTDRHVSAITKSDISQSTSIRSPVSATPGLSLTDQLSFQSTTSSTNNQINEPQPMQTDEISTRKPAVKAHSSSSNSSVTVPPETPDETVTPPPPPPTKGRPPKSRQNSSSNSNKKAPAKTKAAAASRQKQTTTNERKGRPPSTRSKSSTNAPTTVQTRSSNRRNTKTSRYRKRSYSSGSDDDETEDDDDEEDTDFTEEDDVQDEEKDNNNSSANKTKASKNANDKKTESESNAASVPIPPPPPATTTSVLTPSKMSEPLSLLSGLATNPISVSSNFMLPNFNPAFPTPQHIPLNHPFPPGFPLQSRLPMPPPTGVTQPQPTSLSDTPHSSHSTNASETDSLDHSSSPSRMDTTTTNAESGISATQSSINQKPSALSSLLEFGTLPPPSNLGDIRPTGGPTNPYPFPFVTPGPGVPFSPQTAAGMTTYYRPTFNVPPTTTSLDMSQQPLTTPPPPPPSQPASKPTQSKKKAAAKRNSTDVISQNLLDEPSPPKKKARKTNPRGKGKGKKNETDGENDVDEDNKSPPPATTATKKKKKTKKDAKDSTTTDDNDETKGINGPANSTSHNLLAQMSLMNNSLIQSAPTSLLQSSSSANGTNPTPNAQQQQQAQIAAMYNMTPHFAPYNTFPGAFNPNFPGPGYPGGYPPPYGFHPAFGNAPSGQPFPFMPPTPTSTASSINTGTSSPSTSDQPTPIVVPETRPPKSRSKSTTGGEKKKPATPRVNKKKAALAAAAAAAAASTVSTENEEDATPSTVPSEETTTKVTTTSESTSTPPPPTDKRRISGTESEDFDDRNDEQLQQSSQTTNGKSGNESDGSVGAGDRSSNTAQSASTASEKKGGRTTIKPQQLDILNKSYESCSKPNKTQREQLATDTGLNIRVIQVWFQNKRSKERKGKVPKEKETPLDDDEAGDDSQPSSPQPPPAPPSSLPPTAPASDVESATESTPVITSET